LFLNHHFVLFIRIDLFIKTLQNNFYPHSMISKVIWGILTYQRDITMSFHWRFFCESVVMRDLAAFGLVRLNASAWRWNVAIGLNLSWLGILFYL